MLETLRNAWKIEDLRKKIIFTLIMLFIYRVGTYVPVPG
jgi:preprotein translocase subunit SecY